MTTEPARRKKPGLQSATPEAREAAASPRSNPSSLVGRELARRRGSQARSRRSASASVAIERDIGLVLRLTPVTESSCMAVWLTSEGRVVTLVKGAYRRKSPFLGHLDLFRTCELVYYPPRHADRVAIAKEVTVLHPRNGLRTRWRASCVASYLCDLAGRVTTDAAVGGPLLERLTRALDALDSGHGPGTVLIWFELHLAEILGWRPRLASCAVCAKEASPRSRARFFPALGGLVCASCAEERPMDGVPLSVRLREYLLNWQSTERPDALPETRLNRGEISGMEQAMADFLQYHLEPDLRARSIAFQNLERSPA